MTSYLKFMMAALLVATPATVYAHDWDDDVKRDVKETYDFTGFDSIEIEGVYLLDIQQGDTFSVKTEAREKDAEWMDVYLDGDTLVLGQKDSDDRGWRKKKNKNNHKGIRAIITMPQLDRLSVAGIATGHIEAFNGGDVDVEIAGIGDLALSGTCDGLTLEFAGMGDVDASELECRDVDAEMGGMGALKVYASDSVDATIGGMGSIDVYGNPKSVRKDKSMFSSIHVK